MSESDGEIYSDFEDDFDEESDFDCEECGDELDEDGACINQECDHFDDSRSFGGMSDYQERMWERKQMGITS